MLFNSFEFIFIFLPLVMLFFYLSKMTKNIQLICIVVVVASVIFYAFFRTQDILVLFLSVTVNYVLGHLINISSRKSQQGYYITGIIFNLLLLGYFKYTGFLIDSINSLLDTEITINPIILPLAISFFTFQQISYLSSCIQKKAHNTPFWMYALYICFFPQFIAGPIVRFDEVIHQILNIPSRRKAGTDLAIGMAIFTTGLFKKVTIADTVAIVADRLFLGAEHGVNLTCWESALGATAYSFQIYFDFSGYSDMAIGLARMFGIRLPINFYSPYKATGIIDFWKRWHITLSRFLRDHLYIPMGGNRLGQTRKYINIFIVMLLGGIWHGAGWTFVIWGSLHGAYIIANHLYRDFTGRYAPPASTAKRLVLQMLTFSLVTFAWIFFRAETIDGAMNVLNGATSFVHIPIGHKMGDLIQKLIGSDSLGILAATPMFPYLSESGIPVTKYIIICSVLLPWVLLLPNTLELFQHYRPAIRSMVGIKERVSMFTWNISPFCAIITATAFAFSLLFIYRTGEFLYFNF